MLGPGTDAPAPLRWSAAGGLVAVAAGAAAAACERTWPGHADADRFPLFLAVNRGAILAQSLLFLLSAGCLMWFLASLRTVLSAAEGGQQRLSALSFTAGLVGYGLNVAGQAPQLTLTLPSAPALAPQTAAVLADLGYVMLAVANVPLAVMFFAVAAVSLRTRVFPGWLGWLAVVAGLAAALLVLAVADPTGPLAPQGWASYVLYPAAVVWLVPASVLMLLNRVGTFDSAVAETRGRG